MAWTPGVTTGATMATEFNDLDGDFDALVLGFNASVDARIALGVLDVFADVEITAVADNDVLTWESATSRWKNKPASGGGDVGGPGSATDNAIARFDTTTGKLFKISALIIDDAGAVTLPSIATPSSPATDRMAMFARKVAGVSMPAFLSETGVAARLQRNLGEGQISQFVPAGGTTVNAFGINATAQGTATAANLSGGSRRGRLRRIECLVTVAATTAVAGLRGGNTQFTVGGASAWEGGFHFQVYWGPSTGVATAVATHRAIFGLFTGVAAAGDANPSAQNNILGMGWDSGDTNISFMHNDGSGTATKIDLGASFPKPSADRADTYRLEMFSPPGPTQSVTYLVENLETGATATGTVTTDLPTNSTGLAFRNWFSVGGTSSVIGVAIGPVLITSDF